MTPTPLRAVLEERWLQSGADDALYGIIDELTPWYFEYDPAHEWVDRMRTEIQASVKVALMAKIAAALADAPPEARTTKTLPQLSQDLALVGPSR